MEPFLIAVVLVAVFCSFVVSSSVGLGGSLLMVPTLALALGAKEGVALAALLLATNNVFKLIGYRATIPWRKSVMIFGATILGAAIGARLLLLAPSSVVAVAVLATFALTLILEQGNYVPARRAAGPALAVMAGATSGFSGTSGPLKGVAIRNLGFDRLHFVGAASFVSFGGDATKVLVFAKGGLLDGMAFAITAFALPLMFFGTVLGRRVNRRVGEKSFAVMFWLVMVGYSLRLLTTLA